MSSTRLPHTAVEKRRMTIIPHTPFIMLPNSLHWDSHTEVQLLSVQQVSVARLGALPPNPYVFIYLFVNSSSSIYKCFTIKLNQQFNQLIYTKTLICTPRKFKWSFKKLKTLQFTVVNKKKYYTKALLNPQIWLARRCLVIIFYNCCSNNNSGSKANHWFILIRSIKCQRFYSNNSHKPLYGGCSTSPKPNNKLLKKKKKKFVAIFKKCKMVMFI